MKRIIVVTFAFFCIVGLSACSTMQSSSSAKYNSNYHAYQEFNLPPDYPTRYLPDGNLWDDFRKDLQLPINTDNKRIKEQIRWIQSHQDFINRSLTRGAQYFYYIYQQTKIRHLPAELALIPVYESGYVPFGRSNKGAMGLWQFMPRTAAGYGMRMDHWFDGRRDVISSTNAALKYFSYLHYFFNDWLLAIAAYDHGEGNVQAAILRNQRKRLRTDFWSLTVPQETHVYVPQLLALAAVIKNPAKYGVHLVPINNGPYFEQVNVGKAIDINKYAKLAGIDVALMRNLNAGYLRTMMDPDGPYMLLVPRTKVVAFKAKLKGGGNSVAAAAEEEPSQGATTKRETVSSMAKKYSNNNNISVETKSSALKEQSDSTDEDDNDNESEQTNAAVATSTIPYRVAKGDTVYNIAKKFKVSPNEIKSINKLSSNNVGVGKIIKIPHKTFAKLSKQAVNNGSGSISSSSSSSSRAKVSIAAGKVKLKPNSTAALKSKVSAGASVTARPNIAKQQAKVAVKSSQRKVPPKQSNNTGNVKTAKIAVASAKTVKKPVSKVKLLSNTNNKSSKKPTKKR